MTSFCSCCLQLSSFFNSHTSPTSVFSVVCVCYLTAVKEGLNTLWHLIVRLRGHLRGSHCVRLHNILNPLSCLHGDITMTTREQENANEPHTKVFWEKRLKPLPFFTFQSTRLFKYNLSTKSNQTANKTKLKVELCSV